MLAASRLIIESSDVPDNNVNRS